MGEWKQDEYPKRMAADIKKVKEERHQKQQEAIKAAAAHVTAELAQPIHRKVARPVQKHRTSSKTRVAAIQMPAPMSNNFPYTGTKRARRYLHRHPGVPVEQHPRKKEVTSGTISA